MRTAAENGSERPGEQRLRLAATTQGPLYPPSEVMDQNGNFVVVGRINGGEGLGAQAPWGAALVRPTQPPAFGEHAPYEIAEYLDAADHERLSEVELYTLPLPLPMNNYDMLFAPSQRPEALREYKPSLPLNQVPYPDERAEDGPKRQPPISLSTWLRAAGDLTVTWRHDSPAATFRLEMTGLLPNSLYTVMTLRQKDLDPASPTRPGPLGIPNVFISTHDGRGFYEATLPDPFPENGNRVINVIVLWMSEQRNYAGAIGYYGLGGDVHAQLKLRDNTFYSIKTASPQ